MQRMGSKWADRHFWTLVLINLAGIMERADESLLPGVYKEIGSTMQATPSALGSLTLLRCIVQMFCFPLAAYLSVRHNRANVIAVGAFLWALTTFCVGISSSFFQVAVSRALNGIGLAIVIPAIQSLVADSTDESNRGFAFGCLQFTSNIGGILGSICAVLLAGTTVFGISGWRVSFYLIGFVSVVVGILVYTFAVDPCYIGGRNLDEREGSVPSSWSTLKETFLDAKRVIRIPTFSVIVAQGIAGNFPWAAFSFCPMWLELMGFSHTITGLMVGIFVAANSLGGLFGGHMGDILAMRLPNTGRIILAQISSILGVPLGAILLLALPDDPSTPVLHGFMFFITGLLISWCASGTNNPIFAEIVPEKSRTIIYALDRSFESVLAAFAPPLVGVLAQNMYGYVFRAGDEESVETDRQNAVALAKALYTSTGIPFVLCCLIYVFLYWTYPKDRDRARADTNAELQMGKISRTLISVAKVQYTSVKDSGVWVEDLNIVPEEKHSRDGDNNSDKEHMLQDCSEQ